MPSDADRSRVLGLTNIRAFLAFRVLFNARYYYPIFTLLFLDYGLSMEQFMMLNVAWGISIVLLEVPSGALADTVGRRRLLIAASVLMVVEMCIIAFAPTGNPTLLFYLFLFNRVLSGAAEAAASGADEALAYDTLAREKLTDCWGRVLEVQMRLSSFGFLFAMGLGALVFDQTLLNRAAGWTGLDWNLTRQTTMRFPIYLTLVNAVLCLLVTLRLREVETTDGHASGAVPVENPEAGTWTATVQALRKTLEAGDWILKTPFALVVIAAGFLFDSVVRTYITTNSQYYAVIGLPEWSYGFLGGLMAVLGLFMPTVARWMAEHRTPTFNFGVMAAVCLLGLTGIAQAWPYWGLLPVMVLYIPFAVLPFFISHYLNRITASHQRATVLSFKGLSFNLAYALASWLFAILLNALAPVVQEDADGTLSGRALENAKYVEALGWLPGWFVATTMVYLLFAARQLRGREEHRKTG
ncbi:MAG: MFS transporter [Opitutales bacterium]